MVTVLQQSPDFKASQHQWPTWPGFSGLWPSYWVLSRQTAWLQNSTIPRFQSFPTPMSNLTWVQGFVTKSLSSQSEKCMVTKFNNSPIQKLPNTSVKPPWVQRSVTKSLSSQSASCITTRSSFGNRQTGAASSAMQDVWLTNCMVPNRHSGKLPRSPVWPPLTANALHNVVKGGRHLIEWQVIKRTLGGKVDRSKRYFYLNDTWSNCH